MDNELVGKTLDGKYKIISRLGGGGMGVVYRGMHSLIDRPVAIKVLRSNTVAEGEEFEKFLARFRQEARAASRIQHIHAVAVYDFGIFEGFPYLVMQFVDGISLKEFQKKRGSSIPLAEVKTILTQVGGALAEAHRQSIVHRDLKPDNIMIEERANGIHAYVLDFGIAKICGTNTPGEIGLTKVGTLVGTPHYMSPEQIRSQPVDARSDVYSLGIMLYEMLSGEVPFNSDSAVGILMKHVSERPQPVRKLKPELNLPNAVEDAVMSSLEKEPDLRPASMQAFVDAFCKGQTVTTAAPSTTSSLLTAIPRAAGKAANAKNSTKAIVGAGVAVAILAGAAGYYFLGGKKPQIHQEDIEVANEPINVSKMPPSKPSDGVHTASNAPNGGTHLQAAAVGMSNTGAVTSTAGSASPEVLGFLSRGAEAYRLQQFLQARDWFEQAQKVEPSNPEVLRNLAEANLSLEKFVDATVLFERALAIDPSSVKAQTSLGFAFDRLGRLNDAANAYRKSIALKPDYAVAHNNLAFCLMRMGSNTEAESEFLRALALDPRYLRALYNLGDLYLSEGKFAQAVENHRKAAELDSTNGKAYKKLGDTLLKANRRSEALRAYSKALELDANLAEAREAMEAMGE